MFDNWYVVQVRTGKEEEIAKKLQFHIDHDILLECFIPHCVRKKKFRGQWQLVEEVLFRGYIFVITDKIDDLYTQLKKVPDLTILLGNDGEEIFPVYPQEALFLSRFSTENHIVDFSKGYINGDAISIIEGPLMGLEGHITKIDRHKRVAYVDVNLLGRVSTVQVGLEIISKD